MSWARIIVSAAQLVAAVSVIMRIIFAAAEPIPQTEEQIFEQTTYTMPLSSTENDSDVHRVPTKPLNLTSRNITSTTIELSWAEPESANGVITGYRVYYMHSNYTDVQMHNADDDGGPIIEFILKELKPYTEYKIWVKAYTLKNEGEPSDHIIRRTDITGPNAPVILNLTCQSHDSIYLQWARPSLFWGAIDYYYINYRTENGKYYEEIEMAAQKNHLETGTIIPNLTINTVYEIVVRGATKSTIDDRIIRGEGSIPRKVPVIRGCDKTPPSMRRESREFSPAIIAGMVCACFAVMLMITSFVRSPRFIEHVAGSFPFLSVHFNRENDFH